MFFRKKSKPDIQLQPTPASRVEIELAKGANKEASEKAKAVNEHVKDLLFENGITVKIYLAAGGQLRNKKQMGSK